MTVIRRPGAASAAVLIGLISSLVVAHAVAPEWSRRTGLDVWNLTEAQEACRNAAEERADVEARGERFAHRREAANQIASQLITGTTTLAAATDLIHELFAGDTGMLITLELTYPEARTERLRFARHTVMRVTWLMEDDAARREAVVARLEAEYRTMAAAPEAPAAR